MGQMHNANGPRRFDVVIVESDGSNPEKERHVHQLLTSAEHELVRQSFSVINSLVYIKNRKAEKRRRERLVQSRVRGLQ